MNGRRKCGMQWDGKERKEGREKKKGGEGKERKGKVKEGKVMEMESESETG